MAEKDNMNDSRCGGEKYLHGILRELSKIIGLKTNDIISIEFLDEELEVTQVEDDTQIWKCSVESSDLNKRRSFVVLFHINQSKTTEAETKFLASYMIDSLLFFLEGCNPLSEDFDRFCFRTSVGSRLSERMAAEEIFRRAVSCLTRDLERILCFPISVLDKLSLSKYEGAGTKGTISIVSQNATSIIDKCIWRVNQEIPVTEGNVRFIRKLLEGAGKGDLLFVTDTIQSKVTCYGVLNEEDAKNCSIRIKIDNPTVWKLIYDGKILFQRVFDGYQIDTSENTGALRQAIYNEFGCKVENSIDSLMCTLKKIKSRHGTAVIIADFDQQASNSINALQRFERLEQDKKAIAVKFSDVTYNDDELGGDAMTYAASMDGAVIIDLDGQIKYLATILDGLSCVEGALSRGARFNSIKNFIAGLAETDCIMGVVLSEDGGADIISGKAVKAENFS